MALANYTPAAKLGTAILAESASGGTAVSLSASAVTLLVITVNNTLGAAAVYTKLYDVAVGSVVVGTTAPDLVLKVPAGGIVRIIYPEGHAFATALTVATVTTGGTGGVTGPATNVAVTIYTA